MAPDELIDAARRGDLSALRDALRAGADVNATGTAAGTALEAACTGGHLAAASLLLQRGATITARTLARVSLEPDPVVMFLLETADLGLPHPSWLQARIAKEEALADLPALLAALAGGTTDERRQAADRLAAAVPAGVPAAPVTAAVDRAADDTDPQVGRALARLLEALANAGHPAPTELSGRVLAHALARSPAEGTLLDEALAATRARGAAFLDELVWRLREEPPTSSNGARVAAFPLAQQALARQAVDWSAVDRLCGHALPGAREGALLAVGRAWMRLDPGVDHAEWDRRLLLGLADEDASVREQAAALLDEAWRERALVPSIPEPLLGVIVGCLRERPSRAMALTLAHVVTADRATAARVIDLAAGLGGTEGPAAEFLLLCREVVDKRRPPLCAECGPLGDEQTWGELAGDAPPSAFARLQHSRPLRSAAASESHALYRCPGCGARFDLWKGEESSLSGNSMWDTYTLTRREAPDA